MIPAYLSSNLGQPTSSAAACHQSHQHLQQIIRQQDEEIRQLRELLRDLLHDVLALHTGRSAHYNASAYEQTLTRLQRQFDRLQQDMVCHRPGCVADQAPASCADTHFGLAATLEQHVQSLTNEFNRIKGGCLQFLSGMMSLNWL